MNIYPILYDKHEIITEEERTTGQGIYNMGSTSIRVQADSKTSSSYIKVKVEAAQSQQIHESESESCSIASSSFRPNGLYSPWNSPGQNTGVGSLFLLQGIFPMQELNPGLLCCKQILYQLSHKGSPRILGWVAYPFSSGSSGPRNRTGVSCTAGGLFIN